MYNPQEVEKEVLEFWKKNKIQEKALSLRNSSEKEFLFLEGPPSVNAMMHVGHARGRTIKDAILRFKTMNGFFVSRQAGWDMQGLPIEIEAEKNLGVKNKKDIEERVGVDQFVEKCRELALKYKKHWEEVSNRIGMWMDWKNPYQTMDNEHIEFSWGVIKKAHEEGLLFKGLGVNPTCPRCETALAQHEVDQGYKDRTDYSIYVKFPIIGRKNEYFLIWTTTPWTLPANVAVALGKKFDYAKVKVKYKGKEEYWIFANELVDKVMKTVEIDEYEIVEVKKGSELKGLKYEHCLKDEVKKQSELEGEYLRSVIFTDFVTLEDGTGIVHIAPGHGPEDYEAGVEYNLPIFSPVKENGTFTEDAGKYKGMYVFDANEKIMSDLKEKGFLVKIEKITHSYPHCWRCNTPLIYIASEQWYIKTPEIRDKLISENNKVQWIPDYVGSKRFGEWLNNLRNNCISRQKYWGATLPIWVCEKCGNIKIFDSKEELENEWGNKIKDLHKPFIDEVILECDKCKGKMKRVPDVMDVWIESGVAPDATSKYLNREYKPFDFITEAIDQTRGWFYSLLFTNVIKHNSVPYKTVLTQEHVLDDEGNKMSKSKGNVIWAKDAIERYGADTTRFYLLSKARVCERMNFVPKDVEHLKGQFLNILWNSYLFLEKYSKGEKAEKGELNIEDKWIISKINSLIKEVTEKYNNYELYSAAKKLEDFLINDLSRTYIKIIRDRTWPSYNGEDKKSALYTLRYVLKRFIKILSPMCPFITEKIHQGLDGEESIHLTDWPKPDEELIEKNIENMFEIIEKISEISNSIRQERGVGLRYPLKSMTISGDEKIKDASLSLMSVLKKLTNVKEVIFGNMKLKYNIKLNYSKVGPKYGKNIRELEKVLKEKNAGELIETLGKNGFIDILGKNLEKEDLIIESTSDEGKEFKINDSSGVISLDMEETPEIFEERLVRELMRNVQQMRKDKELVVEQRIKLNLDTDEETQKIIKKWTEEIKREVGAKEIAFCKVEGGKTSKYKDKNIKFEMEVVE